MNYKVGDIVRLSYKGERRTAKITSVGKVYISCGDHFVFHKETHKCISGKWEIIGITAPKPKARPRGRLYPKTTN